MTYYITLTGNKSIAHTAFEAVRKATRKRTVSHLESTNHTSKPRRFLTLTQELNQLLYEKRRKKQ